jgi:hypothetical protein
MLFPKEYIYRYHIIGPESTVHLDRASKNRTVRPRNIEALD